MINKSIKKRKFSRLLSAFLWVMAGFVVLSMDMFAQQSYEFTLNQRRMGDTIGVEIWVKTLDANATNLGNMTISLRYNNSFLTPAAIEYKNAYGNPAAATDSISSNVTLTNPVITIPAPFADGTYGFSALDAQSATGVVGSDTYYTFQLDVNLSPSGAGYAASTIGRGSFVGMLKFKIKNHASLTETSYTGIQFVPYTSTFAPTVVIDKNGTNVSALCTYTNPGNYTVRGITILNPNYPNQTINRSPQTAYAGLGANKGYPIYFERSGLTNSLDNYGTDLVAYEFQYSLDNASNWLNIGYVAEKTDAVLTNTDYYVSGDIAPVSLGNSRYITKATGSALETKYSGILRTIWAESPLYALRSEQARMKVTQLSESGSGAAIADRSIQTGATRFDINDIKFVLGRLFFVQLDGTMGYFRSERPFSNATLLTVEAWVNLNTIKTATGAEPVIVASSAGAASTEEGAWMLYLKDGKYPAFRAREIEGRGTGGYIGTVVADDALAVSDPAEPISDIHAENWVHIAGVVDMNKIILYVNGEEVGRVINKNAVNIRMLTSNQPIWVGLNPNGTIDDSHYLHAGIKEVKVWRAALPQDTLRKHIAGVYQPSNAFQGDFRSTLELYYPMQASNLDAATDSTYQNSRNNLNYFENTSLLASAVNENIRYRPDRGHIRLTSPTGNEGVSNLKEKTYPVRWVTYGIGTTAPGTEDLMVQVSRDGGNTWFDAIDNQVPAMPLDFVDAESAQVLWSPYNNATLTGQDDDLQGVINLNANYSKNVKLRISGTETNNQTNLANTSGSFVVAPHFAMKNPGTAILKVDGNTDLNMTEGITVLEAWIRPYRFPTTTEQFFPLIAKKSTDGTNLNYSLRLLPTGQLSLAIGKTNGTVNTVVSVNSTANADSVVKIPNLFESDTAWTHVAVVSNLANGTGQSNVYFFIDGVRQPVNTTLGSAVTVETTNSNPVYFGYEPGTTNDNRTFIGEMKEVRIWNGYAGGTLDPENDMTTFLQGAQSVRANELGSFNDHDYTENLVAAYSMDGGSFINSGIIRSIAAYPVNSLLNAKLSGTGYTYVATKPYLKFIVPVYKQKVANTITELNLRWVGFDYNRNNVASFYAGTTSHQADLEYSVEGGGGIEKRPYKFVANEFWNSTFTNALTLPIGLSEYEFQGTTNKSQFAAKLNVAISDPDTTNDGSFSYQGALAAANSNARLRLNGRSTLNGYIVNYENENGNDGYMPTLRTESQIFTVTPLSNFTVRVLLEGYHRGRNTDSSAGYVNLTTETRASRGRGIDIQLYENNANSAGKLITSANLAGRYLNLSVANRGAGSNNFANVPFILDTIPDGRYFVKVNHLNHLSVASKYAAPFKFSGDVASTWALESGWDFQNWNGSKSSILNLADALTEPPTIGANYTAMGPQDTSVSSTDYATTGLVYNNGGPTLGFDQALPAMVGGDVVRDGVINAADRAKVVTDIGNISPESDVTGDGKVNASDRQIVYRNNGKEEYTGMPGGLPVPVIKPVIPMAPEYTQLLPGAEELTIMFIDAAKKYNTNKGKVNKAVNPSLLASGISYDMSAVSALNGDYIDVSMYAKNKGGDFGFGNCTFAIKYEENKLQYVEMLRNQTVIFNDRSDLGYFATVSAPAANSINPVIGVRTIDINYDNYVKATNPGAYLPQTETYLGTLRFKRLDDAHSYNFSWNNLTVVYTLDGKDVTSNGNFVPLLAMVVMPEITITFPNGGESLTAGRPYTIAWTQASTSKPAYIEFSNDNGKNWQRLTSTPIDLMTGSYNWNTPKINSTTCLVRLVDAVSGIEIDKSDATFSLVSTPALITRPSSTDKPYKGGASDFIRWDIDQNVKVKFEFSENGVGNWKQVTADVQSNKLEINWTLPSVNSKSAVVRMINSQTGDVIAVSSPFKILAGSLTLTSPREGEKLQVGSKKPVRWTYDNVNTFDLYYSLNSGKDWTLIENDVKAVNKSIDWMIPNANSKHAIVKAIYTNDPELEYYRTGEFEIYGSTDVNNPEQYGYAIESVTPNPFSTETVISFKLPNSENVTINVYDANGSVVANLANNQMFNAGLNTITFKNNNLAAGMYIVRINAGMFNMTKDIIHIK